jgi:hypothetical protein
MNRTALSVGPTFSCPDPVDSVDRYGRTPPPSVLFVFSVMASVRAWLDAVQLADGTPFAGKTYQ